MRIRSLTYFLNPGWPLDEAALGRASEFAAAATRALVDAGYEVQTARLACPPFSHLLPDGSPADLARLAQAWKPPPRRPDSATFRWGLPCPSGSRPTPGSLPPWQPPKTPSSLAP